MNAQLQTGADAAPDAEGREDIIRRVRAALWALERIAHYHGIAMADAGRPGGTARA